jgi:hypothetical protein
VVAVEVEHPIMDQEVQEVVHTEGVLLLELVILLLQALLKVIQVVQRHGLLTQLEVVEQVLLELPVNLMVEQVVLVQLQVLQILL